MDDVLTAENPHAGQGPVVLDIGGDVGALIVTMPARMQEMEVEIVPSGRRGSHSHHHHDGDHPLQSPPHVAVVARSTPSGVVVHSLVFGALRTGTYDLYVRPDGPVQLTAGVLGGQVTQAAWPDRAAAQPVDEHPAV